MRVGDRSVLLFLGRTHLYEGRGVEPVVHGVRTAAAAGVKTVILTNAAGGLGAGAPRRAGRGHRRPPEPDRPLAAGRRQLRRPHRPLLRRGCATLARELDPTLIEGVYAALPGPHYETPAEIRMLRTLGADLVGMSTALEAIAARAAGLEVFGLSHGDQRRGRDHRGGARPPGGARRGQGGRRAGWAQFLVEFIGAAAVSGSVLLTGAAGRIGTWLRGGLPERGLGGALPRRRPGGRRAARRGAAGRRRDRPRRDGRRDRRAPRAVVHLAGVVGESTWPAISHANIEGTYARSRPPGGPASSGWCSPAATTPPGSPRGRPTGLLREADAPAAPGHLLRRREGDHGGARLAVRRPVRHGRRLPADRQRVPRADDDCGSWPPGSPPPTPSRSSTRR